MKCTSNYLQSNLVEIKLLLSLQAANVSVKPKSGVVGPRDQSARSRRPDRWRCNEVDDDETEPERNIIQLRIGTSRTWRSGADLGAVANPHQIALGLWAKVFSGRRVDSAFKGHCDVLPGPDELVIPPTRLEVPGNSRTSDAYFGVGVQVYYYRVMSGKRRLQKGILLQQVESGD
ncbi:hypothetical protein EI94DRAFT_1700108 [Lactarius quietus]|nr:hypothetical protein EI94DRAFT_1700108 [Lactarius quietus]